MVSLIASASDWWRLTVLIQPRQSAGALDLEDIRIVRSQRLAECGQGGWTGAPKRSGQGGLESWTGGVKNG
nr:MAG: hypothetical protein J07AB56_03330 [Candidatus Nanosalinarum sp. J07AB56]